MKSKNKEIVEKVWQRMELVLKVLATLADRVDKEKERSAGVATPPAQAYDLVTAPGSVQQQLQEQPQAGPSVSGWIPP